MEIEKVIIYVLLAMIGAFLIGRYVFPIQNTLKVDRPVYITKEQDKCEKAGGKMSYKTDMYGDYVLGYSCLVNKTLFSN